MSTKHQLQYRTRADGDIPAGQWTYHSRGEQSTLQAQADAYHALHGDRRLFDYRVVAPGQEGALAERAPAVMVAGTAYSFDYRTTQAPDSQQR